jgi:hypothetical protein
MEKADRNRAIDLVMDTHIDATRSFGNSNDEPPALVPQKGH